MKRGVAALFVSFCFASPGQDPTWENLSSKKGDLPVPGESTQQTGTVVADFDNDGVQDFVLGFRQKPPALVWYRKSGPGWTRSAIEQEFLTVEAGGAAFDIDGDGDLDLVFGADAQNADLWWWENPYPNFDAQASWKRRTIKRGGAKQHHDQVFADFKGIGRVQLVFWNQGSKTLYLAEIPSDPRPMDAWPLESIFTGRAGEQVEEAARYAEGASAFDVDGDGKLDLLAGNCWFKHEGGSKFTPIRVGTIGGRIAAGKFKRGRTAQVVIAPGDGTGPLKWYEASGDPLKTASWIGHVLLERVVHGHSLQLGDINGDGHLDIFAAEMAKWTNNSPPDHPDAKAWIFYGDGRGHFRKTVLVAGHGWHEARLADLDGDGDLDILNKPYTWETPRIDIWINSRR